MLWVVIFLLKGGPRISFYINFILISINMEIGHLMQRTDSFGKTLMLGKIEAQRRRGQQRMKWLYSITNSMNMNLNKFRGIVEARGA